MFGLCAITITAAAQPPTFTILAPNSGVLTNGTSVEIRWIPPTNVSEVRLILCPDETHGSFITQSTANSGTYTWVVNRQGYDTNFTTFFITVDGCTPDNWCGTGSGGYFTIVDAPPNPAMITGVSNIGNDSGYQYLEIDAIGDNGFTHYLEYSFDVMSWKRLTDSPEQPKDGKLSWYVKSANPRVFFRVVATY